RKRMPGENQRTRWAAVRRGPAIGLLAGFIVTFLGMLLLVKVYTLLPDGRGAMSLLLWRFYLAEIPRLFSARPVGSAAHGGLISTAAQHALISLAVGGLSAASVA